MKSNRLTITFLLPGPPPHPIGGCKIAYQYANHLCKQGHKINVVHFQSLSNPPSLLRFYSRWKDEKARSKSIRDLIKWFRFEPNVNVYSIPSPHPVYLPFSDVTIATAWKTAPPVASAPKFLRGKGLYLIQHIEDWDAPRDAVLETWKLPLQKIVISHWLENTAQSLGEPSYYIPNGLDFEEFGLDTAPEDRNPNHIGMLWHDLEWKGSKIGLRALCDLKALHPTLTAEFFGTGPAPAGLPDWITYLQQPNRNDLRKMYNRCSIFLTPSFAEGWALPPAEALQCGCALAATEIGGHQDYAIHEKTAITFPTGDHQAITQSLALLLENPEKRLALAHSGHDWIQQFTWERAIRSLNGILHD